MIETISLKEISCSCELKEKNIIVSLEERYKNRQDSLNISNSIIKEKCYYKCVVKQIQS